MIHAPLPDAGPLIIELFAGSATLSALASTRGYSVLPVDWGQNKHRVRAKVHSLDLSQASSWRILEWVLDNREAAAVYASPPGVIGSEALQRLCSFLRKCQDREIHWVLEAPSSSSIWASQILEPLRASAYGAHCDLCALDSLTAIQLRFISISSQITRMQMRCRGCSHCSAPYSPEEMVYPRILCSVLCDVFDAISYDCGLVLGASRPVLARANTQPRGRLRPQVVPEYRKVQTLVLPDTPQLDAKRCLMKDTMLVPSGSKLLRSEKRGDGSLLCVFGIYRSPVEFLREARNLWHPYDNLAQMPDYLIKCIFEQLTLSPLELSKKRIERLMTWKSWAKELAPRDRELKAALHPDVARVLQPKNLALMERLLQVMEWPDKGLLTELMDGFRLVGRPASTGLFRAGVVLGSLEEEELMDMAPTIKSELLAKIAREPPSEHAQELLQITREEADSKGWLRGPFSPQQIDDLLGTTSWLPVRRFAVLQGSKLRPIDDLKENRTNEASGPKTVARR